MMATVTYPHDPGNTVYVLEECGVKKGVVQSVVITDVFNVQNIVYYIKPTDSAGSVAYRPIDVHATIDEALAAERARVEAS